MHFNILLLRADHAQAAAKPCFGNPAQGPAGDGSRDCRQASKSAAHQFLGTGVAPKTAQFRKDQERKRG